MTIREIIEIKTAKISTDARPVFFLFASWIEVCSELNERNKSKIMQSQKYPLLVMHREFSETIVDKKFSEVAELNLYVLAESEEKYTSEQREEIVLTPVIDAIVSDFIEALKIGPYVVKVNNSIEYETKRFYNFWVGDKLNKLPDNLDAIEIKFTNLKYYRNEVCNR